MKNLLSRARELPEGKRKIIFWTVIIILTLTLSTFYIRNAQKRIVDINAEKTKEELQLPYLEEGLKKLPDIKFPKIEMPEIDQGALQELERTIEEMPTEDALCEPAE
jgi:hypothetical protein